MTLLTQAGAAAAALLAIAGAVSGAWWVVRRLVRISDAVAELVPNGGKSIKDQVTRTEHRVAGIEERLAAVETRLDQHHHPNTPGDQP